MRLIHLLKRELAQEVRQWLAEGTINRDQAQAILARYDTSLEQSSKGHLGYYLLMSFGVLFLGLALILLISENWQEIPRMARTLALGGLTLASNLMGVYYVAKGNHRVGVLWLLFAGISFGTSIMLIAQIYHLGEHYPDGIFIWALGILPWVILVPSRLLAALSFALACTWLLVDPIEGFMPYSFPLFCLVVAWLVFYVKESAFLFLAVLAASLTWFNLLLSWADGGWEHFDGFIEQIPFSVALGLLLNGWAWWLMRSTRLSWKKYGLVVHIWMLRASLVLLFVLSFDDTWKDYIRDTSDLTYFSTLAILIAGAVGLWLAKPSGRYASLPIIIMTIFYGLSFYLAFVFEHAEEALAVAVNLLLVALGVLLIRRGIDQSETHYFYTGVGVLLLLAFLRYVDLIGDYLGGALLFMVAAGVMMAAARYWKRHAREEEI